MTESIFPKRCRVYPRNGLQFIPGILEKRERIEFPAELPLTEKELRRCMSFADVYEVREEDCVYLDTTNYYKDNADAEAATDVPDVELLYPRDEKEDDDEEEDDDHGDEDASGKDENSKGGSSGGVGVSPGFDGEFNLEI